MTKKESIPGESHQGPLDSSSDESSGSSDTESTSHTTDLRHVTTSKSTSATAAAVTSSGTDLRSCDVLLGRGTGPANHPGNIYFRDIVERVKPSYVHTPSRKVKNKLVLQVVNDVKSRGGRFLRKQPLSGSKATGDDDADSIIGGEDEGIFEVVTDAVAFEKTKQAIRYVHYKKEPNEVEKRHKHQPWAADAQSSLLKSNKRQAGSSHESIPSGPKRPRTSSVDQDLASHNARLELQQLSATVAGLGGATADSISRASGRIGPQDARGLPESLPVGFSVASQGSSGAAIPQHFYQTPLSALLQQQQLANLALGGHAGTMTDPRLLLLLAQHQHQQQSQNQLLNHLSSSIHNPFRNHLLDALLMRGNSATSTGLAGAMTSLAQQHAQTTSAARLHALFPSVLPGSPVHAAMSLNALDVNRVSDSLVQRNANSPPLSSSSARRTQQQQQQLEEKSISRDRTGKAAEEKSSRSPRKTQSSEVDK
jgi:hypothetical protein